MTGELQFFPSSIPLSAQFKEKPVVRKAPIAQIGSNSIVDSIANYKKAKSHNPWLRRHPLILREITPVFENDLWHLIDGDNYSLPIPKKFNYGWHLAALASDGALAIFGLWNGTVYEPISILIDSVWRDLHTFRGIK